MLPSQYRLRGRNDLASTVKDGDRIKGRNVIFHVLASDAESATELAHPQVAFAVSRRVGGSVERHRVTRRLRHVTSHYLDEIPNGTKIVIRANPRALRATPDELRADFSALVKRIAP